MFKLVAICVLSFFFCICNCRDFYMGMFKRNDFLVAHDRLYKERVPYTKMFAQYGKSFTCPITYFRVVDRLGVGSGPTVRIIRGGLQKKYIVARIISPYNTPISVNIYVGCENKRPMTKRTTRQQITPTTEVMRENNDGTTLDSSTNVDQETTLEEKKGDTNLTDLTTVGGDSNNGTSDAGEETTLAT